MEDDYFGQGDNPLDPGRLKFAGSLGDAMGSAGNYDRFTMDP